MRPRQAIILSIGAAGAGLLGASVHGVGTVNADLESLAPVRQQIQQRVIDTRHDCPLRENKVKRSTEADREI
jgi:hypothetical protein